MRFLKSVRGVVLAGAITLAVFLGVPILSSLGIIPPLMTVEQAPERVAVYYWEAGNGGDDDVQVELELQPEDLEPAPEGDDVEDEEAGGGEGAGATHGRTDDDDEDALPEGDEAAGEGEDDASRSKRPNRRRRGRKCEPDPIPQIRKVADDRFRVRREIIKEYTKNFGKLNSLGWSRTHRGDDGKADGMSVGGVRCNNDLHRAGIRSGDVIHSVNGHKVRNLVQALAVYGKVRKDRVLRVEITRRGKPRTLTYRIAG